MTRRTIGLFVIAVLACAGLLGAQVLNTSGYEAYAFESISVTSGAAVGGTVATYQPTGAAPVRGAMVTCDTANVRYRMDGGSPTTTVGHQLPTSGWTLILGTNNVRNLKFIAESTTATVRVTYLR